MFSVENVTKTFGRGPSAVTALNGVSLSVAAGDFVSIVGPSGCGKTTLLMCMAGLDEISSGSIRLQGAEVHEPMPQLSLIFQDYSRSLFPWLTVRRNVSLPLTVQGRSRREIDGIANESLRAVGLERFIELYPWQLSGGMQQRVAIARALALKPRVLLMDEPFASVDAQTRIELEDLLLDVWTEYGVTVVFVTHDIDEAVYLSDRVVVLSSPPTVVKCDQAIELPRPRDQIVTKEQPEYAHLRTRILRQVMRTSSDESVLVEPLRVDDDQGDASSGSPRSMMSGG